MKKTILTFLLVFSISPIFAHYIWLETAPTGKLNQPQTVKVRFGEFTHGVIEKVNGEAFQNAKEFTLWVVAPDGTKQELKVTPKDDYYLAEFTPTKNGVYTLALDNKNMHVLDYAKYDYTIFKPQYHAKAKVVVGNVFTDAKETNTKSIEIVDVSKTNFKKDSQVILKVLFKGKPLGENEVSVFMKNGWTNKLNTDKNGEVTFKLPFNTKYTVEATHEEKTPGKFKNKDYKLIWHCATYCIIL